MKKFALMLLAAVFAIALVSCDLPSYEEINGAVELPDTYSITYQIREKGGAIRTVAKTRDGEGNVYFRSGDEEYIFIKDGIGFAEYKKDEYGTFVKSGAVMDGSYVNEVTKEFTSLAEKSLMKLVPGIEEDGETELLGRACRVYSVKLGGDGHNLTYSYYVDIETGICLGFETEAILGNVSIEPDEEIFVCIEFSDSYEGSLRAIVEG